jgi:hypothetical protein
MAKGNEELKQASELEKARGETPSQQEVRSYHEGDFQTTDPVTGEKRENTGGTWQTQEEIEANVIGTEISAADLAATQKAEVARSAGGKSPAAKKAARKRGR